LKRRRFRSDIFVKSSEDGGVTRKGDFLKSPDIDPRACGNGSFGDKTGF